MIPLLLTLGLFGIGATTTLVGTPFSGVVASVVLTGPNPGDVAETTVVPAAVVVVTSAITKLAPGSIVTDPTTLATASFEETRDIGIAVVASAGEPDVVSNETNSPLYVFPDAGNKGGIGVSFMVAGVKLELAPRTGLAEPKAYGTKSAKTNISASTCDAFISRVSNLTHLNLLPSKRRKSTLFRGGMNKFKYLLNNGVLSGSLMLAKKTIKAKILELREGKRQLLEEEYQNYQEYLGGNKDVELYSATRQQAERFLIRLKKQNGEKIDEEKDYPLILRNDVYDVQKEDTKLTQYWIRIPVAGKRGRINCPIAPSSPIPDGAKTREAKIIKKDEEWYVYITVQKEVEERKPNSVLAIDMGIRNIATTVNSNEPRPIFYGKELREVKGHFYNLRKKLQKKSAYGAVKKIGNHERRTTDSILHTISKKIVEEADKNNSVIVLGDLKGIRANRKGRSFNRRLNSFPFYRFTQFITYKASWLGIPVIKINEAYTSQLCHDCGEKGLRVGGRFSCKNCGHEYNADYNGAYNIMKRAIGYMSVAGAGLTQPGTR